MKIITHGTYSQAFALITFPYLFGIPADNNNFNFTDFVVNRLNAPIKCKLTDRIGSSYSKAKALEKIFNGCSRKNVTLIDDQPHNIKAAKTKGFKSLLIEHTDQASFFSSNLSRSSTKKSPPHLSLAKLAVEVGIVGAAIELFINKTPSSNEKIKRILTKFSAFFHENKELLISTYLFAQPINSKINFHQNFINYLVTAKIEGISYATILRSKSSRNHTLLAKQLLFIEGDSPKNKLAYTLLVTLDNKLLESSNHRTPIPNLFRSTCTKPNNKEKISFLKNLIRKCEEAILEKKISELVSVLKKAKNDQAIYENRCIKNILADQIKIFTSLLPKDETTIRFSLRRIN